MRIVIAVLLSLSLSGCLARTALDVATLPVKVATKTVDVLTTSQAEADQKRGRQLRKEEEARGREARRMAERCRKGRALPTDICPAQAR